MVMIANAAVTKYIISISRKMVRKTYYTTIFNTFINNLKKIHTILLYPSYHECTSYEYVVYIIYNIFIRQRHESSFLN